MRRLNFFIFSLAIASLFSINSCKDEGYSDPIDGGVATEDLAWTAATNLQFTPVEDKETFVWEKNLETLENSWSTEEMMLDVHIQTNTSVDQFSKIEFYLTAEELDGYNYTAPFETEGMLAATVSDWDEEGNFTLSLNATEVYGMFQSKFTKNRSSAPALKGDVFELHWVISGKDGQIFDSREKVDGQFRYGFTPQFTVVAPPVFRGEFILEWLTATDLMMTVAADPSAVPVIIGTPKNVTISYEGNNVSTLEPILVLPITMTLDPESGLLTTTNMYDERLTVISVNGTTMTMKYVLGFYANYGLDASGTFTLKRTDGENWPANLHSN